MIKDIIIFKTGDSAGNDLWYTQQVLLAIGLSPGELKGTQINSKIVSESELNVPYISGFAMTLGHNLAYCTLTPFTDADLGQGMVLKVFQPDSADTTTENSIAEGENTERLHRPLKESSKRKQVREIIHPLLKQDEILQHWAFAKTRISLWHALLAPVFLFAVPLLIVTWSGANIKLSEEGSGFLIGFLIAGLIIGTYIYFFRKGVYKYGVGLTNKRLIIIEIGKGQSEPIQYYLADLTKSDVSVGVFVNLIIKYHERTIKLRFANNSQDNRDEAVEIMKPLPGNRFTDPSQPLPAPKPQINPVKTREPEQLKIEKRADVFKSTDMFKEMEQPTSTKQVHVFYEGNGSELLTKEIISSLHPEFVKMTTIKYFSHNVNEWPADIFAYAFSLLFSQGYVARSLSPAEVTQMLKQQSGSAHGQRFFILMYNI